MKSARSASSSVTLNRLAPKDLTKKDDVITAIAVEGTSRFTILSMDQVQPYRTATVKLIDQKEEGDHDHVEVKALMSSVQKALWKYLKDSDLQSSNSNKNVQGLSALLGGRQIHWPQSPSLLADMVGAGLGQLTAAE